MDDFTLVIGNRNYSSWSMRGWLAAKQTGAAFTEHQLWLDEDPDRQQRLAHAPTGKVPVLKHGERVVWDSLAITEYLAELFPDCGLWPTDSGERALARSLVAEMHSGFPAIREHMPLNCRARREPRDRGDGVRNEVARIQSMWSETRATFGNGGPYLFGSWCAADIFYAPVASRFVTYAIDLEGAAAEYRDALLAQEYVAEWIAAGVKEPRDVLPFANAL